MILVVEPDTQVASRLAAALHPEGAVRCVERFSEAAAFVRSGASLTLLIIRRPLADGAWDSLIEEVRAQLPRVPVLVVGDAADADTVRRVFSLDATFTCAPLAEGELVQFVRRHRSAAHVVPLPEAMLRAIEVIATKHQLRAQQLRVIMLAIEGRSRREIARALSLSENTVKSQIRDLLRKCEVRSLTELCRAAFRSALAGPAAGANHERDPATTEGRALR